MTTEVGLREAKKQRTREHIAAVATRLFLAQGFEATTIAQVAREAGVAKMTVTNYFPVKEDLLFDRAPELVPLLADAVAGRPPGSSPLRAVRDVYRARLAARWPLIGLAGREMWRLAEGSPALRARWRQILAEQEEALARTLIAEAGSGETDGDAATVRARVCAARVAGVFRVLFEEGRRRVLDGDDVETVATAMDAVARAAFAEAERGSP